MWWIPIVSDKDSSWPWYIYQDFQLLLFCVRSWTLSWPYILIFNRFHFHIALNTIRMSASASASTPSSSTNIQEIAGNGEKAKLTIANKPKHNEFTSKGLGEFCGCNHSRCYTTVDCCPVSRAHVQLPWRFLLCFSHLPCHFCFFVWQSQFEDLWQVKASFNSWI